MPTISSIPVETLCQVFQLLVTDSQEEWTKYLRGERGRQKFRVQLGSVTVLDEATRAERLERQSQFGAGVSEHEPESTQPYAWTRITHVCRSWRAAALEDPFLWTHVPVTSANPLDMVDRAAGLPLTVTADYSHCTLHAFKRRFTTLQTLLETHAEQIAVLIMPFDLQLLTPSFAAKADQLRSLAFIEPTSYHTSTSEGQLAFASLEQVDFIAPLRQPVVSYLCVGTLRTLTLLNKGAGTAQRFTTLAELTRALVHSPLLEYLIVELGDHMDDEPPVTVELQHLRKLHLMSTSGVCGAFLRLVKVPPTAQMSLRCDTLNEFEGLGDWWGLELSTVPEVIQGMVSSPSAVSAARFEHVLSLDVTFDGHTFTFKAWRAELPLLYPHNDPTPDAELRISMLSTVGEIRELFSTMPFRDVRVLRQGSMLRSVASFNTARALCLLPQLQHVTFYCLHPQLQCELLGATPAQSVALVRSRELADDERASNGTCRFVTRVLTKLILALDGFEYAGTFQDVVEVCRKRDREGRALRQLALHEVHLATPERIREIEEIVECVIWDPDGPALEGK